MPYDLDQYQNAETYFGAIPGADDVVNTMDAKRIRTYNLYDAIYRNSDAALKITMRGDDALPMYIPSAKKIVEATGRFLGVGFSHYVEPEGDETARQAVEDYMVNWFKREQLQNKFTSNKRWGLVRGDAVYMLYGDLKKDQGQRISIAEVHPRQVFRIEDANNSRILLGYYIVEVVQDWRTPDDETKTVTLRRSFRKETRPGVEGYEFTGRIIGDLTFWENGKWDDRPGHGKIEPKQVFGGPTVAPYYFPDTISQLPIYQIPNNAPQNSSWGTSLLAGFESLIFGLNQALTDEDFTLVMQGLGLFVTNAGPPIDPTTKTETSWDIGPGQVLEVGENQDIKRLNGVSSVSPYQDHMTYINDKGLSESSGTPDIAIGRVDVQTAESGISLKLQLMPLLSANTERESIMVSVLDQMFYDIVHMWLPAFEEETFNVLNVENLSVVTLFDDPMPVNRDTEIQETILLYTSDIILLPMVVAKMRELGWKYPSVGENGRPLTDYEIADMLMAQAQLKAVNSDPYALTGGYDSSGGNTQGSGESTGE